MDTQAGKTDLQGNYDVVIVGGSFAGLAAALPLARARRSVLVVDSGSPRNRRSPAIHDFISREGTPPLEILAIAGRQIGQYPSFRFHKGEVARARALAATQFLVTLESGEEVGCRRVILAFGVRDILPKVPGVEERWGRTVFHCPYCHGYEFGRAPLGVLNVGATSAHHALIVSDWGPVTFFSDGAANLDSEMRSRFRQRSIVIESSPPLGLVGDAPDLQGVRLADGRLIKVAGLFVSTMTAMRGDLASQLGCTFEECALGEAIVAGSMRETSVPGVYAAGDISRSAHNVALAVSDGLSAGIGAHQSLVEEDSLGRLEAAGASAPQRRGT